MRKILKLVVLLIMLSPILVSAEFGNYKSDITYEEAQKIVKEVMRSYYIRGEKIQYNNSKTNYPIGTPEEATWQDINYSVCAAYTYSIHNQTFGMLFRENSKSTDPLYWEFPRYNYNISDNAYAYYKDFIESSSGMKKGDGSFLIYYQHALLGEHDDDKCEIENINNDTEKIKYLYGDNDTNSATKDLGTLINNMRPGDLVVYSGHALIVYDVVTNPNTGKKDALILNSTADDYIRTRIDGTSKISYTLFPSPNGKNNVLDVPREGSIQFLWFSEIKQFVNSSGALSCQEHECAVIRTFYDDGNGKAVFNYSIDEEQYKKAKLRNQYPGLLIEKTVSLGDNNSVNLGDTLTYTIKITNKSGVKYDSKFSIKEILNSKELKNTINLSKDPEKINSANVKYVTQGGDYTGVYNSDDDTIVWSIPSLAAGKTITLTYEVLVEDKAENLNKTVLSVGEFFSSNNESVYLTTGTVQNPVIVKNSKPTAPFSSCYAANKTDYTGLALIDAVYECAYGDKYKISFKDDFKFNTIFEKYDGGTNPKNKATINFTTTEKSKPYFSKMILNNYFNGIVYNNVKDGKKYLYYFPRYTSSSAQRARTINPLDFKEGDVLIYYITSKIGGETLSNSLYTTKKTNEEGIYAYIYINGKFVGVNGNESDKTIRNEFSYKYYFQDYARHASEATCTSNFKLSAGEECDIRYFFWDGYYKDWSSLNESLPYNLIEYINYQTLFGKNYYAILRPQIDEIIDIRFQKPTKTKYIQNYEDLDLTGGKLSLTYNEIYSDVGTDEIELTNTKVKVTGFDNSTLGTKTLTVKYGSDYTTTYDIEIVSKQIESISVSKKPTKLKYIQGFESLELIGGELTLTYNDTSTDKISLDNPSVKVTGFDNSTLGTNTLTVEYEGKTTTFTVEIIQNPVSGIKVSKNPTKLKYIQNYESLDLTGGELTVTYNDNTTSKISLDNLNVKVSGFSNTTTGTKTLTVEYAAQTTTFTVEIISKSVSSIKVSKNPTKTKYIQNYESLDLTGGELTVTYNDTTTSKISLDNSNVKVSGFSNTTTGTKILTAEYEGKTTTFDVEIISKSVSSIKVSKNPTKTKYIQNYENLDLTGGELTVTYNDTTTSKISLTSEEVKVSGFSNSSVGVKTLTVEYSGKTTTFTVEIIPNAVSAIKVSKKPIKLKYIQNYESLDLTGGELTVTYNDTTTSKISLTSENVEVTGFNNSALGTKTLTVEYEGQTTTFTVEIISKSVSSIKISKLPIKNNYIQNYENLDLTGGELTVTYNDKTTSKISLTSEEVKVSGFDYSKLGKQTITVEYEGKIATFEIEILTKQINTIKVTKVPAKVKFIKGTKELDLTGGELTVTYNDESIDVVSLTNEKVKVSGFDSSEYGVNTLTIEYLGRTATLNIEIISRTEVENPNTGAVIGIGLILIILGSGIFYTLTRKKSKFLRHN